MRIKCESCGHIGRPRKYPPAKVGDKFGDRTVTQILPRDSTSNERVEWRCQCGKWGQSYVFNLRAQKPVCTHAKKPRLREARTK